MSESPSAHPPLGHQSLAPYKSLNSHLKRPFKGQRTQASHSGSVFCTPAQGGYLERHKKKGVHDPQLIHATNTHESFTYSSNLMDSNGSSSRRDMMAVSLLGVSGLGNFTDAIHTNLDLLTLGNVPPGSKTMWVHLISVYAITLVALKVWISSHMDAGRPHQCLLFFIVCLWIRYTCREQTTARLPVYPDLPCWQPHNSHTMST